MMINFPFTTAGILEIKHFIQFPEHVARGKSPVFCAITVVERTSTKSVVIVRFIFIFILSLLMAVQPVSVGFFAHTLGIKLPTHR